MHRILVIDDDHQLRAMLKQFLERNGYEVLDAPNGAEGIRTFGKHGADLIITDLIMPEKEGIEIIMELSHSFPDVKIIAISGGGRVRPDGYLKMAKELGAARTFTKPLDREKLIEAVQDLLTKIP